MAAAAGSDPRHIVSAVARSIRSFMSHAEIFAPLEGMAGRAGRLDDLSRSQCAGSLELMLTHRGDAAAAIDLVLRDDPDCVRAHCLRAAFIVSTNDTLARRSLAASLAVMETAPDSAARRHAQAARAWLEGDVVRSVARYGAVIVDRPD